MYGDRVPIDDVVPGRMYSFGGHTSFVDTRFLAEPTPTARRRPEYLESTDVFMYLERIQRFGTSGALVGWYVKLLGPHGIGYCYLSNGVANELFREVFD